MTREKTGPSGSRHYEEMLVESHGEGKGEGGEKKKGIERKKRFSGAKTRKCSRGL